MTISGLFSVRTKLPSSLTHSTPISGSRIPAINWQSTSGSKKAKIPTCLGGSLHQQDDEILGSQGGKRTRAEKSREGEEAAAHRGEGSFEGGEKRGNERLEKGGVDRVRETFRERSQQVAREEETCFLLHRLRWRREWKGTDSHFGSRAESERNASASSLTYVESISTRIQSNS